MMLKRSRRSIRTVSEEEIDALIDDHEDQHFDCKDKRKKPSGIPKYVAGFANASGGILVLGLKDKQAATGRDRLAGFADPEAANAHIATICNSIDPAVEGLHFTFIDCGEEAGFLLQVRVPRSSYLHRVGGIAYCRDGAATNKIDERRTKVIGRSKKALRWSRRSAWAASLVLPLFLLAYASAFAYGKAAEPKLATDWLAYPTALGLPSEYDLRLEIGETAGAGIVDLAASLEFPTTVLRTGIIDHGGCEGFAVVPYVLRGLTYSGAREKPGNRIDIRAARCPARARPVIRLEVADGSFVYDSPLVSDNGRLDGSYGWLVPVLGFRAPSRRQLDFVLKAPHSQWHAGSVSTRAYPAGFSNQPYYDLEKNEGQVVTFLARADFESLPDTSLTWLSTPSARIRLSYEQGKFKGWIRWLHCERPIEVEAFPPGDLSLVAGSARAIALQWKGCRASLSFAGATQDEKGNFVGRL